MRLFPTRISASSNEDHDRRSVTIRQGGPHDAATVAQLAAVDSAFVPEDPLLLALVDGELWVALSLATGALIADPFRPTEQVARVAAERARQLSVHGQGRARKWSRPNGRPARTRTRRSATRGSQTTAKALASQRISASRDGAHAACLELPGTLGPIARLPGRQQRGEATDAIVSLNPTEELP